MIAIQKLPMTYLADYNITFWEGLGFDFDKTHPIQAGSILLGERTFGKHIFHLQINGNTGFTKATVSNLSYQKIGNHILAERDAIEWFSSFSSEFARAVSDAGYKAKP
jgi:hypothetical protein